MTIPKWRDIVYSQDENNNKNSFDKTKGGIFMVGSMKLADEILANASVIPVECQEHILDVIKAMAFTRKVIEKNQTINVKKDEKVSA